LITSFGIKKHGDAIGGVHINSEKKGYKAATKQMVAIFALRIQERSSNVLSSHLGARKWLSLLRLFTAKDVDLK
jgi:hypothetical protein